jgi:hypothetical protein
MAFAFVSFLSLSFGIWIIMQEVEQVRKIAQSHLDWHVAYSDWEREKSRAITQSSPRARLSYRRRRA